MKKCTLILLSLFTISTNAYAWNVPSFPPRSRCFLKAQATIAKKEALNSKIMEIQSQIIELDKQIDSLVNDALFFSKEDSLLRPQSETERVTLAVLREAKVEELIFKRSVLESQLRMVYTELNNLSYEAYPETDPEVLCAPY